MNESVLDKGRLFLHRKGAPAFSYQQMVHFGHSIWLFLHLIPQKISLVDEIVTVLWENIFYSCILDELKFQSWNVLWKRTFPQKCTEMLNFGETSSELILWMGRAGLKFMRCTTSLKGSEQVWYLASGCLEGEKCASDPLGVGSACPMRGTCCGLGAGNTPWPSQFFPGEHTGLRKLLPRVSCWLSAMGNPEGLWSLLAFTDWIHSESTRQKGPEVSMH